MPPLRKSWAILMGALIRLAALGTFPLQGGRLAGGHMGPPLRANRNISGRAGEDTRPYGRYKTAAFSRRGRSQTGPPRIRTRSVGSATPGAGVEPRQFQFSSHSGPSGAGRNCTQALLILRAGNFMPSRRDNPRNGGPGVSGPMGTKCPSAASPGDSLVTFSSLRKSLAARRRRNSPAK